MSYQETKSVSWFGRIKRSFGGVVVGLSLIVGMIGLLFWNEGRAVQTARSLAEGAGLVVPVDAGAIDPAGEGSLIHISGPVATAAPVGDPEFGIAAEGVRLMRSVEMFQWIESSRTETKTKLGGGEEQVTTYSYGMAWSDRAHDSSKFKDVRDHQNPPMAVDKAAFQVDGATLGAFRLESNVLNLIGGARDMPIPAEQAEAVQQAVGAGMRASIVDGGIYLGIDPLQPRVGDYRIGYRLVPAGTVSVVGRQAGSSLDAYQTEAGNALLMVSEGAVPAQEMFDRAASSNTVLTWGARIAGLGLLIFGFSLVLGPLGVIGDVVPFVGSIVRMGTGVVAWVAGILVGSGTIALAWFFYRPVTAIIVIAAGIAAAIFVPRLLKRRHGTGATDGPAAMAEEAARDA